jgi:arylsulfatase
MTNRGSLCAVVCGLLCCFAFGSAATAATRPNIILIMADDMGFSDIGCYGGEIQTPNLDRLAAGGLQFTQFYNTGRCCPTRAALLTGLYSHQAGVGHMMGDDELPGYRGNLNRTSVTIAEALRPAGYSTYMAGKWHVTKSTAPDGPKHNWPLQRGFDRFYGTIHGAGSFYDPNSLTRDNTQISPAADSEYKPETYYYTDAISDHAVRFITEHAKKNGKAQKNGKADKKKDDKPFFLYVAYTAAHWPMHALEKDIAKYRGKYDAGYSAIRRARYTKMKKLGLLADGWKMTETVGNWDAVKNRDWEIRCMEVYAAMVDNMDQGIGRIVASLEAQKQLDNTLILFLQDNGGCAESLGRRPRGNVKTRPAKAPFAIMPAGELQRAMIPRQTRDGFPLVMGPGAMPGPADTYIAYGQAWANVSNTPFRRYKHWVHEGGISTPLIAHWPTAITKTGKMTNQPSHLIDIMATCVDVAEGDYPRTVGDRRITPLEGASLKPLFGGAKSIDRNPIFWEHEGNRAVREGRWKLVSQFPGEWELYDMQADRTELNNLAAKKPEMLKHMTAQYDEWSARARVVPWKELQQHRKMRRNKNK